MLDAVDVALGEFLWNTYGQSTESKQAKQKSHFADDEVDETMSTFMVPGILPTWDLMLEVSATICFGKLPQHLVRTFMVYAKNKTIWIMQNQGMEYKLRQLVYSMEWEHTDFETVCTVHMDFSDHLSSLSSLQCLNIWPLFFALLVFAWSACCSSALFLFLSFRLHICLCASQQCCKSFSSHPPPGGFTFYELMQRGVPLNLIDKYMNEAKIVEQEK